MKLLTSCVLLSKHITKTIQLPSQLGTEIYKPVMDRTWLRTRCCNSEIDLLENILEITALRCFDTK
jgi:hypothetical protein